MKKKFIVVIISILLVLLSFFLIRAFSERQIDDVTPGIQCEPKLLEKSDVLYIIPKFNNILINENKGWCNYISSLNKTLALHGVYHTFNEFDEKRNDEYLKEGINIFEDCFGFKPDRFKPPQLAISKENSKLIKKYMSLDLRSI